MDTDSTVDVGSEATGTENSLVDTGNSSGGGESSGFNPAWNPLLEKLPEQVRPLIRDDLSQWDKNYQDLQGKYRAFESVPEDYRNPETLQQMAHVWQTLATDPHAVLNSLAQTLGVSLAEAQQIVEQQEEPPVESNLDMEFSDEDDPRLKQLADALSAERQRNEEFFQKYYEKEQAEQQQAEEAQYLNKFNTQVQGLIDGGHVPNDNTVLKDLADRATLALERGSKDPIMDAFKEQKAFMDFAASRNAPKETSNLLFLPASSGSAPANAPKAPDLSTAEGRMAYARRIAEASSSG